MRSLLQTIFLTAIAFYITTLIAPGLSVSGSYGSFLAAAAVFAISTAVLKIFLSVFAFPFAFLSTLVVILASNAAGLYVTALVLKSVKILPFTFSAQSFYGITTGSFAVSGLLSYVVLSVIIALLMKAFHWLFELE